MSKMILKIILVLTGIVVAALGINIGFGGMATLGLQGSNEFFSITNQKIFDVQDNHIRFIGGILLAIGLVMIYSAIKFEKAGTLISTIAVMFFIGGLTRLSALDMELILSSDILPSLLIELIGFPILALWTLRENSITGH